MLNQASSMAGLSATFVLAIVAPLLPAMSLLAASATSSTEYALGDTVPLNETDLRAITLQVLKKNPLLSSSSGIKFASAQRSVRSTDIADIIYYPHAESAGIKHAFQVKCHRQMPDRSWTCQSSIRRYLQLESQDFEVRVKGNLEFDEALALIEATRGTARASVTDGAMTPETAIMISSYRDRYHVDWGDTEGYGAVTIEARLTDGGDPAQSEDWQTKRYDPNE